MKLSIVMPVYNEIATIAEIIRQVLEASLRFPGGRSLSIKR